MREFDLRSLQLKELECLKEIDRICRKYDWNTIWHGKCNWCNAS